MTTFFKGYIEGYYGKLFSFAERSHLLKVLKKNGANVYVYAPKEDPYHRRYWREAYPKAWQKEFQAFVAEAKHLGISVIPGMAPGLSYNYTSKADYKTLLKKLQAFAEWGCQDVALLMDDISPELPTAAQGKFNSLGEAHALLLQALQNDLKFAKKAFFKKISNSTNRAIKKAAKLWFCPTVYTDQFSEGPIEKNVYLLDLANCMPENIPLLWTGPRIISEKLRPQDLSTVTSMFPGRIVLWDNLYANDYCPSKLFVGPYRHRPPALTKAVAGLLLNPTGLPETDRFVFQLMAGFAQAESSEKIWEKTLHEFAVPPAFKVVADFLDSPFFKPQAKHFNTRNLQACKKALFTLLWEWKSPLQREWYAFLYGLDHDLSLYWKGKSRRDGVWIRKKYAPALAPLLENRD